MNELALTIRRYGYSEHSERLVLARVTYNDCGREVSRLTLAEGQLCLAAFDSFVLGDIKVSDDEFRHLKDLEERFPVVIFRSNTSKALQH